MGPDMCPSAMAPHPASHNAILLVSGRMESYIKYQELAYELFQQGYSVYLYDHRGQGFSGRMLSDPHKGYGGLQRLRGRSETVPRSGGPGRPAEPAVPALSPMGGAIAAHYLQQYPHDIHAAVLAPPCSASIWGCCRTGWPAGSPACWSASTQPLGIESPYAPSQGPYDPRRLPITS